MKTVTIAYEIEEGVLKPHDHPVFTGEAVYDLTGQQDISINKDLGVREFTGPDEAFRALKDYHMEHPKGEQVDVGNFILLQTYIVDKSSAVLNRSGQYATANKGLRKETTSTKKK
jgi:hypothetical protein